MRRRAAAARAAPAEDPAGAGPARPAALLTAGQALRLADPDLSRLPWLIVSDFDGTLSPLVLDPWGAQIIPEARQALRRLAGRERTTVALLSGRAAKDLAARVRVGGALYLGNHGLEWGRLPRGGQAERLRSTGEPAFDAYEAAVERIALGVERLVPEPWLIVERKPPALGLHFRAAPDVAAAAIRVQAAVDALDVEGSFERFPGKRMLELRPPGATTKGEALARLLQVERPGFALVLGDDVSDAAAFRALREARGRDGTSGLALAVHARADLLPEVVAAADGVLASPHEAARLLASLARWPEASGARRLPPGPSAGGGRARGR
ncbi:MAG: trehalose-phosphatase [Candidatus Limnocylindrales bacterium]